MPLHRNCVKYMGCFDVLIVLSIALTAETLTGDGEAVIKGFCLQSKYLFYL